MRDFNFCLSENGVQVADSSSSSSNTGKNTQNLVTCIYQSRIWGKNCLIRVSWTKNLMGQCLIVGIDDSSNHNLCKFEIKPWLFTKRKGSKNLEVNSCRIGLFWDLSSAKFRSGPEPVSGFYVCVVVDKELVLVLGDLKKEAFKKTNCRPSCSNPAFIAKKEHVSGKKLFATKARFCDEGKIHDLVIECDTTNVDNPCLVVRVDSKTLMQVRKLKWKFRGYDTIVVDKMTVEVLWDVHDWLFGGSPMAGNAVFMFRTYSSSSPQKMWPFDHSMTDSKPSQSLGFSYILYAWKNE